MQYFGVPKCPYCKKRVNFIRTWSLKRQGEYQCPRCGGISNIFLSPLVYVFALLAVFSGAAVYFFHKFILDDVDLTTVFQVILPFAVFFLLSLFLVYLAKPVIKRVPREEQGKKARPQPTAEDRRAAVSSSTGRIYADQGDYLPPVDYRSGPAPRAAPAGPGSPAWGEPSCPRGTGSAANFPRRPAEAGCPAGGRPRGGPAAQACPTQPGDPGPGFLRAPAQRAGRCPASRPAKAGACSQARGSSPAGGSPACPTPGGKRPCSPAGAAAARPPRRQHPAAPASLPCGAQRGDSRLLRGLLQKVRRPRLCGAPLEGAGGKAKQRLTEHQPGRRPSGVFRVFFPGLFRKTGPTAPCKGPRPWGEPKRQTGRPCLTGLYRAKKQDFFPRKGEILFTTGRKSAILIYRKKFFLKAISTPPKSQAAARLFCGRTFPNRRVLAWKSTK